MATQDGGSLFVFGQRASKVFDLGVGNLYEGSISAVHDLRDQYLNEGIASLGKYLRKTFGLLANDFQGVEQAFKDAYLQPLAGADLAEADESWLRQVAQKTLDREVARVKDVFGKLSSSFAAATPGNCAPYLAQFDQLRQRIVQRLDISIDLLRPSELIVPSTQTQIAPQVKRPWLPDGWKIVRQLGEGGQGWTYLVRRAGPAEGPSFVFKRLKNHSRADRFETEIKALKRLPHHNILTIVEDGKVGDAPYYVAEYCENGDLSKWEPASATLLEKVKLFRQIADAISAAHKIGIIHRDIKPFNILMRSNGSVVVGDFGLCIDLNDNDGRLTSLDEPVGPRNYIAPELEDGRLEDPEPSADIYSLGKLLYFLLTARSFSREKHRTAPFDLLHPGHGSVESDLHFVYELLDKTIEADPKNRYRDATTLRDAVDEVIMRMESNANVLELSVRQRCVYCVVGEYRPMVGTLGQHSLSLVCWNCGNVQHFTTQNTAAQNWWFKK